MELFLHYLTFAIVVFVSSIISGIVGMIGGMVLLAAMGLWFPPAVLIPLHGCIQLVSNGSRAVLLRKAVDKKSAVWFLVGAVAAAGLASIWLPAIPQDVMNLFVGCGCLVLVWLPVVLERFSVGTAPAVAPAPASLLRLRMTALGGGMTFLSLIAGAVGPLLDAFMIGRGLTKQGLLGTKAVFQVISHGLKIVVFLAGGFALVRWGAYILLAIPLSITGNFLGRKIMERIPHRPFLLSLRILVSALSVLMLSRVSW